MFEFAIYLGWIPAFFILGADTNPITGRRITPLITRCIKGVFHHA